MKSNVLFVSICVLIVGLFSLCACTATVNGEETDHSDPGTSQPEITGTDPTYGSGLTEKTYDPNAEESGDFGSLFGSDASAQSQQGSNSAAEENADPDPDDTQPTGVVEGTLHTEENADDGDWKPWF